LKNIREAFLLLRLSLFLLMIGSAAHGAAQVSVTTYHYDNARTGQNLQESTLTQSNIANSTFGKLFNQPVDGYIVGQPLYLQNVVIPGAGTHNVVYVATMHDSVYAFDGDSNAGSNAAALWHTSFTDPAHGVTSVPIADQTCGQVTSFNEIGVISTMVVDPVALTLYVVAKTEENGSFVHRLHALDAMTGLERPRSPIQITGSVLYNGKPFPFVDKFQMNRPGLVLNNGVLYIAFGTLGCRYSMNSSGWLMAYDATSLAQLAVFSTNPKEGYGAGIWQGGAAPAIDDQGNVYFSTADGPFDSDDIHLGDSVLKLAQAAALSLSDYFTPSNQAFLRSNDLDLGSAGVVILPDQAGAYPHLLIAVGKEGTIYSVNRDDLGHYDPDDGDTQIPQVVRFATGEVSGDPIYWNNTLFFAGEGFPIEAFSLANGVISSVPIYQSVFTVAVPNGLSLSANGGNNGILWATSGSGNITMTGYNANNLKVLYTTNQVPSRDQVGTTPHFATPTVANGHVYLGATGSLLFYGLLPSLTPNAGNRQTGNVGTQLPVALQIQAKDSYSGQGIANVTVTFSDNGAGGSFGTPVVTTNSSGVASSTYTLPTQPGVYSITAISTGYVTGAFTETATAAAASIVTQSGFGQTAPVNTKLPSPVCAVVKDASGNKLPGISVSFTDSGAGGQFSSNPVITNSAGSACVNYTTPGTPGTVTISASVTGVTKPATFKETVTSH
jgi:hypothetical protein